MGVIEIVGVDPDYQRRRVGARLTEFAAEHMRRRGMDIAVIETGGDRQLSRDESTWEDDLGLTIGGGVRLLSTVARTVPIPRPGAIGQRSRLGLLSGSGRAG
jgi:GNAT superfamily N-acetyltransferase